MIEDDGDIIKALGFVTLYSAFLEEHIDNLLISVGELVEVNEKELRWPVSRKIKYIIKALQRIEFDSKTDLIENLKVCKEIFEDRNELVHGRIYSNFGRGFELKSGRYNIPDREVESSELYKVANECDDFRFAIYRPTLIEIPRAINEKLNKNRA